MNGTLFIASNLQMGGIQRVTSVVAEALAQKGHDITLLNISYEDDYYPIDDSVYLKPTKDFATNLVRMVRKLRRVMKYGERRDILREYYLHKYLKNKNYVNIILNPELFIYYRQIHTLVPQAKIYLWMHNTFDVYVNSYFKDNVDELLSIVKAVDGVICLEHTSEAAWKLYNVNTIVLYNPLTLPDSNVISDLQSKVISFTSRLVMRQKGLDYVVELAKYLPDSWSIRIAGDGKDLNRLVQLIHEAGLAGKIKLTGALNNGELEKHYLDSSIFILTSRWEGFGLVLVEAMSRGLPVVAFDIPAVREIAEDGKSGILVPQGDVPCMAGAIQRLIVNQRLREEYGRRSLLRARDFSLEVIIPQWERWLDLRKQDTQENQ